MGAPGRTHPDLGRLWQGYYPERPGLDRYRHGFSRPLLGSERPAPAHLGRTRNAAHGYGRVIEGLSEASRQWNRVVTWLEQCANDQSCEPHDLEHVRPLIGQAMEQQRRLWALTQEVQQELLAVGGQPLSASQQEGGPR